jgi:hypothetical protein
MILHYSASSWAQQKAQGTVSSKAWPASLPRRGSMKLKGSYVVVWVYDEAARLFLALSGRQPKSRWAILGKCVDVDDHSLWVAIDRIDQTRPKGKEAQRIHWTVKPQICSINWNWIITVQVAPGESVPGSRDIGFTSRVEKT